MDCDFKKSRDPAGRCNGVAIAKATLDWPGIQKSWHVCDGHASAMELERGGLRKMGAELTISRIRKGGA